MKRSPSSCCCNSSGVARPALSALACATSSRRPARQLTRFLGLPALARSPLALRSAAPTLGADGVLSAAPARKRTCSERRARLQAHCHTSQRSSQWQHKADAMHGLDAHDTLSPAPACNELTCQGGILVSCAPSLLFALLQACSTAERSPVSVSIFTGTSGSQDEACRSFTCSDGAVREASSARPSGAHR